MANTVAIFIVLADERWKAAFPVATSPEWAEEYANNERILLASIGAAVQNIQLAVTAVGLTSAWLSGGGEDTTNDELARSCSAIRIASRAIGTIPVGVPEKDLASRYRRPLEQMVHWNRYEPAQFRPEAMVDYYMSGCAPVRHVSGVEDPKTWDDADKRLGLWRAAFTGTGTDHA